MVDDEERDGRASDANDAPGSPPWGMVAGKDRTGVLEYTYADG